MRILRLFTTAVLLATALATAAETLSSHVEKSMAPKPSGRLKVEASFHDITVTVEPRATVEVAVDMKVTTWPGSPKDYLDALQPVFEETGNTLLIRSRVKDHWMIGFMSSEGRIDIRMPPGMAIILDTGSGSCTVTGDTGRMDVSCDTGSGEVRVEGTASDLSIDTGSGGVSVRLAGPAGKLSIDTGSGGVDARVTGAAGRVHIDTGSGDVSFRGETPDFYANTGSGSVEASELAGSARFDTGSGGVRASWTKLPAGSDVKVDAGSGEARLEIPSDAVLGGMLEAGSGGVHSDFPGTLHKDDSRFTLAGGPGASTLRVETSSGSIALLKKA